MKLLKLTLAIFSMILLSSCSGENSDSDETPPALVSDPGQCDSNESTINFSGIESISSVTNTSLQLNWTTHSDAQGYALFDVTSGTAEYVMFVDAPATSASITGLTSNTSYTYQVKSVDSEFKQDANTQTQAATTTSAPPDQLLDTIANSTAVFSVRKLSNAYTGNAIAVRRDSDDVVADIGFDGYDLDVAALNAHLSGANGFVETWYDQSGSGQNLTQTNTSYQPQIIASGTPSGMPAINFDGVDDYLINSSLSYTARTLFFSFEVNSAAQSTGDLAQLWGDYSGGQQVSIDARTAGRMSFDGSGSATADHAYDGAAYTGSYDTNPDGTAWVNDTTHTLAVEFSSDQVMDENTVGSLHPAFSVGDHQFGGDISEILVFSDVKSSGDKSTIESSITGYFN